MNQTSDMNATSTRCLLPSYGEVVTHTLAYVVLMVLALVGNLLVVLVIYQNKPMRSLVNCFILNMSLSDLIVPLVIVPRKLLEIVTGTEAWTVHGPWGDFLCKFVYFITDITPSVTVLSLVFMTVDRFYAVFYPMKAALIPKSYRIGLVALTWIISIIFFSPYFKSLQVTQNGDQYFCRFNWSLNSHIIFSSIACVVFIIIPFAVLIVLYSLILVKLQRRKVVGLGEELQQQKERREKTNIAVLKLAFAIILAFALCWGPYNSIVFIYSFVWGFKTPPNMNCTMHTINAAVVFIAYSNTAINPMVYFILNKNYREGLRNTLRGASHRGVRWTRNTTQNYASDERSICMEPLKDPTTTGTCMYTH